MTRSISTALWVILGTGSIPHPEELSIWMTQKIGLRLLLVNKYFIIDLKNSTMHILKCFDNSFLDKNRLKSYCSLFYFYQFACTLVVVYQI